MERTLHGAPARFAGGLEELADGVFAWLQPNGGWGESNAGLVVGDGEALLVDTLWDPVLTRRMLDAMAARDAAPIRTLVNTHSDGDHVWGNQLLEGAEIVATASAAAIIREDPPDGLLRFQALAPRLRRLGRLPLPAARRAGRLGSYVEAMLAPFDFSGVRVVPPTRTFTGELALSAGGRDVRLIEVGPAHTPGDLVVHVPDAAVVFAADVLFVGVTPVMWAGPVSRWTAALDRVLALDPAVIVPGHGPPCGRREVEEVRRYLEWVEREALPRLEAGRSPATTAAELLADEGFTGASWAGWDSPERVVVTVTTIDRARRGVSGPVSARERAQIFAAVAALAA
jgi:glyoxylase-like metal-dependent hydrolase (beta-lactamase superfamily II)